jgi:hypothetical protein
MCDSKILTSSDATNGSQNPEDRVFSDPLENERPEKTIRRDPLEAAERLYKRFEESMKFLS